MKIYIVTDLEGISGITHWDQTRNKEHPLYQEARHLLTKEINACVEGCLEGGADEIIVNDGHGGGFNLVPEELHTGATYVTGPNRPSSHPAMDSSVDGLILLGYHAMAGTKDGVLYHTQSSLGDNRYWYNGVESGEIAQSALVAGYYDIPPIMCTGDNRACEEAIEFLGDSIVTVQVKEGLSRTCCRMVAPKRAREMIRDGACEAMSVIDDCAPYRIDMPIRARMRLKDHERIDSIVEKGLSRRVDAFTVEREIDDPRDIHTF